MVFQDIFYRLINGRRLRNNCKLLKNSGFFDGVYYTNKYPDIKQAGADPVLHYLTNGACEGRNPSATFNTNFYLENNPDVVKSGMNPLVHYILHGIKEDRQVLPLNNGTNGPGIPQNHDRSLANSYQALYQENYSEIRKIEKSGFFNEAWYEFISPDVVDAKIDLVLHFILHGRNEGRNEAFFDIQQVPDNTHSNQLLNNGYIDGKLKVNNPDIKVLLCAHMVGKNLAGAENSFLDLVNAFRRNSFGCIVCLPGYDQNYVNKLLPVVDKIYIVNYKLWNTVRYSALMVDRIGEIIVDEAVDLVYVNTIMIREPLIAARNHNIPGTVHIREMIMGDAYLAESIGLKKEIIRQEVLDRSDFIIANSPVVAKFFNKPGRTFILPNTIDPDLFDFSGQPDNYSKLSIGLISSNIPKKGIYDFIEVARLCIDYSDKSEFLLIGPEREYLSKMPYGNKKYELPENLKLVTDATDPVDAVSRANIIVNLSLFSESFGRTVLEAMAAGRPVIAYDFGAIADLVSDGENGYLVPFRDRKAVAEKIIMLINNPRLIEKLGNKGKEIARSYYSTDVFTAQTRKIIQCLLSFEHEKSPEESNFNQEAPPFIRLGLSQVSVIVPNFNYGGYLSDRLNSIINQSLAPREIIVLDDASTDNSVELAESILTNSNIPFKIIRNANNLGTYRQWVRGIDEAKGKFLWIAEADDTADQDFIIELQNSIINSGAVLTYCQSEKIDADGTLISPDNLFHTNDLDQERWKYDYVETGHREVIYYLFYRNSIPNVSACLFNREVLAGAIGNLTQYKFIGDWYLYVSVLSQGSVSYISKPLNSFRRHSQSVTKMNSRSPGYLNELITLKEYIVTNFPVISRQFDRMRWFLNRDFKIDGVALNSEEPSAASRLKRLEGLVQGRQRLVFLTTNEASHWGGSEQLWIHVAQRCRDNGHDVIVVNKDWIPEPYFYEEFRKRGIKILFREDDQFFNQIVIFKPDLMIFSLGDQDEGVEYYTKCKEHNISYVIINQLTKEPEYWPVRPERNLLVREGYLNARNVFFTSENNHVVMEKRLQCELPHYKVFFQPYYVSREENIPFPSFNNGVQIAIPAKLLTIHKGQHLAIEVMNSDKWRKRNVFLNLYGIGADEENLKKMVVGYGLTNVRFFKPRWELPDPDLVSIWRENHAILMPSFMEGMPLVVINALMCARVAIVTDIGGHREIIEDNITGFIAPKPKIEDIDDAMERAYQMRHLWEEIGKKARTRILEYLPEDPIDNFIGQLMPFTR